MIESILRILDTPMAVPPLYGWYHIMWIVIAFAAAWALCKWFDHSPDKEMHIRRVVFVTAAVVIAFEALKMVHYNLLWEDGGLKVDMQWYAFPFQFCSTPMYVGLLTGLFCKGKVNDALTAYLASYAVFAGVCVMAYPGDAVGDTVFINIQTMVCHSSMLTVGLYLVYTGRVQANLRTFLKAVPVFAVCVLIAVLLNEAAYRVGLIDAGYTFNMFLFSPYCEPSLPVFSAVQRCLKYPWPLFVYVTVFTVAGYVILILQKWLIHFAAAHKGVRKQSTSAHAM